MIDVIKVGTNDQLIFTLVSAIMLIVATLIFTLLPAKNPEWENADERV